MKITPEQVAAENAKITETSLSMMEELVQTNKAILEVLQDIAGMIEEVMDQEDEEVID